MLERMARASYTKNPTVSRGREFLGMLSWGELKPWQKQALVEAQREALVAAREPNQAITGCEAAQIIDAQFASGEEMSASCWRGFIDAILKEQP